MQRSVSVTPPPRASSPGPQSTLGPSTFSATPCTSSKRPRTPADDHPDASPEIVDLSRHVSPPPLLPRRKRTAVWKGWVEGCPPPTEKLINLDALPAL